MNRSLLPRRDRRALSDIVLNAGANEARHILIAAKAMSEIMLFSLFPAIVMLLRSDNGKTWNSFSLGMALESESSEYRPYNFNMIEGPDTPRIWDRGHGNLGVCTESVAANHES